MTRIVDLKRNLSLLTDFYELTMSNGYFLNGMRDRVAVFDTVSYTHLYIFPIGSLLNTHIK